MIDALAFGDTETTGTEPELHEMWEIAFILRPADTRHRSYDVEHLYRIKPTLRHAQPEALEINRFHERTAMMRHDRRRGYVHNLAAPGTEPLWSDKTALADRLADLFTGRRVVGINPGFDTGFLRLFMTGHGHTPVWHYHPIDVKTLAAGYLIGRGQQIDAQWRTDELAERLGVTPAGTNRHTALGDTYQVRDMFDTIMGVAA